MLAVGGYLRWVACSGPCAAASRCRRRRLVPVVAVALFVIAVAAFVLVLSE